MENENVVLDEKEKELDWHLRARKLNFFYGNKQVLFDNTISIARHKVTTLIGPTGCGKSTHVRVYNRLYELYLECRVTGQVLLNDEDILSDRQDILKLRQRIGMVFPRPTPFPMNIFENVAYGIKLKYRMNKNEMSSRVESALKQVSLWEEVRDRLDESALNLTKGQQQKVCIARTIAVEPEMILMDEPMLGVDHVSMMQIEELINVLKSKYTIVLVTQNMQQAARIADYTAFFYLGKIIEFGPTNRIFTNPKEKLTENYITGRFG